MKPRGGDRGPVLLRLAVVVALPAGKRWRRACTLWPGLGLLPLPLRCVKESFSISCFNPYVAFFNDSGALGCMVVGRSRSFSEASADGGAIIVASMLSAGL